MSQSGRRPPVPAGSRNSNVRHRVPPRRNASRRRSGAVPCFENSVSQHLGRGSPRQVSRPVQLAEISASNSPLRGANGPASGRGSVPAKPSSRGHQPAPPGRRTFHRRSPRRSLWPSVGTEVRMRRRAAPEVAQRPGFAVWRALGSRTPHSPIGRLPVSDTSSVANSVTPEISSRRLGTGPSAGGRSERSQRVDDERVYMKEFSCRLRHALSRWCSPSRGRRWRGKDSSLAPSAFRPQISPTNLLKLMTRR